MTEKNLPNFAQDLLHKIAKENGFDDYTIENNYSSKPGEGLAGLLFCIKISDNKSDKKLELMCKVAPDNAIYRKEFCTDIAFHGEAIFYTKLMPAFAKFQQEKNLSKDDQFRCYPKCYGTFINSAKEEYAIVLEDLTVLGYEKWPKSKLTPAEHVYMSMRELGKFHGLSIALKDQKPNEFAEYKKLREIWWTLCQSENMQAMYGSSFDRTIDALQNEKHKIIVRHVKDNFLRYVDDCFKSNALDRFHVVNHGDFWLNNILYRYDEKGILKDIQILDFQTIRFISPAQDIFHNVFHSTDKVFRDKEYENVLKLYYESLAKTVRLLGSDPGELFTFANLKDELKRFGNYLLIMSPLWISTTQVDPSGMTGMDEMFDGTGEGENKPDLVSGFSKEGQREFERRINGLLEDIIELGYYRKIE